MYVAHAVCDWSTQLSGLRGLRGGCSSTSCHCGGACGGMGRHRGMGLFDSADFTTWGWGEWATIGVGVYLVLSFAGDVGRTRKTVSRYRRQRRRRMYTEGSS